MGLAFLRVLFQAILASAAVPLPPNPLVTLDEAIVSGTTDGRTHKFLGIPYGKPPIGDLRFRPPQMVDAYEGALNASAFGLACPQQSGPYPNTSGLPEEVVTLFEGYRTNVIPADEDCLFINVVKPDNVLPQSGLPVVAWIHGGGFEVGASSLYNGSVIVDRSMEIGEPIIYVSFNYRLSAWGFLASKEVKDAGVGNLGLQDQRLALRWIQKYIRQLGGDPDKVTLWGDSAGACSITTQMLVNDGDTEGLFRGAFVHSGSPLPTGDLEHDYDALVNGTGCAGSPDTLACLRTVPYDALKAAVDTAPPYPSVIPLAYMPRADGVMLSDAPQRLIHQGKVANIPIVSGDCDDEGTLFSIAQRNVTTDDEWKAYLQTITFSHTGMPEENIDTMLSLYPQAVEEGSPFDTGRANAITPQFKRIAAFTGDLIFQGPRRFFLGAISDKQDVYSFLNKRTKDFPVLGAFHDTDVSLNAYAPGGDLQDYIIRFIAHLNPNGDTGITWPKWTSESHQMLSLNEGEVPQSIVEDTYRKEAMDTLNQIMLEYPF
ncbi:carotenoid ester lipase precursor [Hymenopellis radicata]|nr:carotenoid ester lipase precursor [Hymenopellis radicata]